MTMTYIASASILLNLVCILIIKTQKIHIERLKREQLPLEPIEPQGAEAWGGMYYDVVPDVIYEADYSPVSW